MLLEGKRGIVFGVANKRSIAWAIARAAAAEGATLAFNFLGEKLGEKVNELAATLGERSALVAPCDATKDDEVDRFFDAARGALGGPLDFLVHCIAFALREDLQGSFADCSRQGFLVAQEVSAYSLVALARRAAPLMEKGGSILTLTYIGSERAIPNYNVMGVAKASLEACVRYLARDLGPRGVRVNGISAGPINTLSARGIAGFTEMLDHVAKKSPLGRNIEAEEVADVASFLLSDRARAITGEVIFVDAGFHAIGM